MKKIISLILIIAVFFSGIVGINNIKIKAAFDFSEYTPRKGEHLVEDDILYMVYDDYAEAISYLGTDGNMDIKPYIQGKPVTSLADWYDVWDGENFFDIIEHSIDSPEHKVRRLVIPHTVKDLKVANLRNGDHHSLFEYSDTLEELVIEDGAEIAISSIYEDNEYARYLNLINADDYRHKLLGNLRYVYIGSGVKEISTFLLCGNSMAEIEVSNENPYYSSENNILFNHNKTELIISGTANQLTEYTVPETVEKIGFGFQCCQNLSKLTLGKNIKSIMASALYTESRSLEIIVPYDSYAEEYTKGLKADYIKCTVLGAPEQPEIQPTAEPTVQPTEMPIIETPTPTTPVHTNPTMSPMPSSDVRPTTSPITVPSMEPTVSPSQMPSELPVIMPTSEPVKTPEVELPLTDEKIKKGSEVIDKNTKAVYKITETENNRTVEYIKSTIKNPVNINVPASIELGGEEYKVTAVGNKAFKGSKTLKTVKIGKNVKKIGQQAFSGCKKLTKVSLGKNVTDIESNAFSKCIALPAITIPSTVKKIGSKAFFQCKNLRYILIKTKKLTAKNVGKNAFGSGYISPRVKTNKKIWKRYSRILLSKGMSNIIRDK